VQEVDGAVLAAVGVEGVEGMEAGASVGASVGG